MSLRRERRGKAARGSIVAVSQKTCPSSDANGAPDRARGRSGIIRACGVLPAFPVRHPSARTGRKVRKCLELRIAADRPIAPSLSSPRPAFLIVAVLLAAVSRLVPHPPNFTPIGAIALFGGASFADRRAAFLVPLAAMFASDLVLGIHLLLPVVYACFAFNVVLGWWLRPRRRPLPIAFATVLGLCVFFVVTNTACWALWYPRTLAGLVTCYVAAIPFFKNTVLGDSLYTAGLFAALALAERLVPALCERALGGLSPAT